MVIEKSPIECYILPANSSSSSSPSRPSPVGLMAPGTLRSRLRRENYKHKPKLSSNFLEKKREFNGTSAHLLDGYISAIHNTKMNVTTRNNLLRKLSSSKWGTNASTIRTTALALSYSVAEYAAPVWARSAHAYKLYSELNSACRAITVCPKPTNVEELYLLSAIAPPSIRRDVCARVEKAKQETNEAHSLHWKIPAERRLKYRNCFLHSGKPANFPPKVIRCSE